MTVKSVIKDKDSAAIMVVPDADVLISISTANVIAPALVGAAGVENQQVIIVTPTVPA